MNSVLQELGGFVRQSGMTYDMMEDLTKISRGTLCRLAQGRLPLMSVQIAGQIAHGFGYELVLRRRK